jgi:glycosyltransferase involved in cell wall biosynthesis
MKILFYNHTGKASGAERLLLMILARLDRERFEPVVLCPETGPLMELAAELAPVVTIESLQARFTWRIDHLIGYLGSFLLVIRGFRQKVLSINPDLVHANSIRAGLVATAATIGLQTRVVWHLHDLLPRHPLSCLIRASAFLSMRTQMIAVSQAVADNFIGRFFPLKNRVRTILNAIELENFQPSQTAPQQIREEFQLDPDEPLVGIVGQLTARKGQLELVRAFALVLREIPRARLFVVGAPLFNRDEDYEALLKKTARKLGIAERVRFTGARTDVAALMQAFDLLVINSSAEPFGLVAVEAMASGTPVLAAACGGIPEIIQHGRNGWLVEQGNEDALGGAVVHLISRPALRSELAERGCLHVASHFSAKRYLSELQTFYRPKVHFKLKLVPSKGPANLCLSFPDRTSTHGNASEAK